MAFNQLPLTMDTLAQDILSLEQSARARFLASGHNQDAEEWHKIRYIKEKVDIWIKAVKHGVHSIT